MDEFELLVDGINLTPYIAFKGFKRTRNDIDSPDTGRTLDGLMHRGRVAKKIKLNVICRPLKTSEAKIVFDAIEPEFVTVTYLDIQSGLVTKTMYSNNVPASYLLKRDGDEDLWDGIEFPLVER